ncbi:biotin/lipoyl-containing protein [Oryzobacter telluris]|uniref:biotin/lipoyl-containing protein n=1 Tax=Oryzobacter telluris TaxID=3149179 RepID=UPI00370DBB80
MTWRWWQKKSPIAGAQPRPGHVATHRASGPQTPQQALVWDALARREAAHPATDDVLTLLEELAADDGSGSASLTSLGRARGERGAVRLYGCAGDAEVPPFVLLVETDAAPPSLHVVTPDLDVAVVAGDALTSEDGARLVVIHPVPLADRAGTVAWIVHVLSGAGADLADTLRQLVVLSDEPDPNAASIAQVMLSVDTGPPGGGTLDAGPEPGAWDPPPVANRFPAPALPGADPPPLPPRTTFAPQSSMVAGASPVASEPGVRDPALEGLAAALAFGSHAPPDERHRWTARLSCSPPPDWAVVRLLRLEAGLRVRDDGASRALLLEDGACRLVAALLDVRSLPSDGILHRPVPRLRLLHERLLPVPTLTPRSSRWSTLLGVDAVLDELDDAWTGLPSTFSVACDTGLAAGGATATGTPEGPALLAVVAGVAPSHRAGVLAHAQALAAELRQPEGPMAASPPTWVAPPGWHAVEELQLTTETFLARVTLEPLAPGTTLDEWEGEQFARAPFLRDRRELGMREPTVDGLAATRLRRFDWQPSGRGRLLTTVCVGVTDDPSGPLGFAFVADVDLTGGDLDVQPDEVLRWLRVLRPTAPAVVDAVPPPPVVLQAGLRALEGPPPRVPTPPMESAPGLRGSPRGTADVAAVPVRVPPLPDGGDTVWVVSLDVWPGDDVSTGDALARVVTASGVHAELTSPCAGIVTSCSREEGQNQVVGKPLVRVAPEPAHSFAPPARTLTPDEEIVWAVLAPFLEQHRSPRELAGGLISLCGSSDAGEEGPRSLPHPAPDRLVSRRAVAVRWPLPRPYEASFHVDPAQSGRSVHVLAFGGGRLTEVEAPSGPLCPPFVVLLSPSSLTSTAHLSPGDASARRAADAPWLHVLTRDAGVDVERRPLRDLGPHRDGAAQLLTVVHLRSADGPRVVELRDLQGDLAEVVAGALGGP